MKTKNLLLSLFLGAVALFAGCTAGVDESSSSKTHVGTFDITQEATSTTSVTISWPVVNGSRSCSTVCVYSDANLTNLIQEYMNIPDRSHRQQHLLLQPDLLHPFHMLKTLIHSTLTPFPHRFLTSSKNWDIR